MTKILEQSRPQVSVLDFSRDEIEAFLRQKLTGQGVKEAYLFGSYILNKATPWSDLDLLIVMPTELPFCERAKEFSALFDLGVPVDILVYTPDEFAALKKNPSGFWRSFQQHHLAII